MMRQKEEIIRIWFDMWLGEDVTPMDAIFTDDVTYVECWGHQYIGKKEIRQWFADWHKNNQMQVWNVKQFIHESDKTVVTWHMEAVAKDGSLREIEGVYLIEWDDAERIRALEEYGASSRKTRPYA